jgi:predicted MFS family arabinose efflux permease
LRARLRLLVYAPQHGRQSVTVAVLAVAGLMVVGLLAVWIPLSPALEGAYGLSVADSATSGVFFAAAFAIGELAAGPLADGYGRRPVLLLGLALLAVATVVVAASPTWPVYLAARVGQGAAAGTFPPVALTWVSEALPAPRRTLALGVVVTALQASAITGQLYGQVVGEAIGWRWVYLLLAGLFALVTVILVRRLHEPRQRVPGETDALALARSILKLLRVRVLLAAWLLGALLLAAIFGVYGGMQVHLPAGVGQDGDLLVWIRAVGLLGILAVPVVLWRLGDRDPMGLIVAGVVVCAVGLLVQTLTQGTVALGVGSVAVAGGATLAITLLTVLIGQFAPAARATALAIQAFTFELGVSGGAWLTVRLSWPELCSLIAAAVAAGALLVAVAVRTQRLAGWMPAGEQ